MPSGARYWPVTDARGVHALTVLGHDAEVAMLAEPVLGASPIPRRLIVEAHDPTEPPGPRVAAYKTSALPDVVMPSGLV